MRYIGGYWHSYSDHPSDKKWIPGRVIMGGKITTDGRGAIVILDINKEEERVCKGEDTAGEKDSDYEKFVPKNEKNTDCMAGWSNFRCQWKKWLLHQEETNCKMPLTILCPQLCSC